MNIVHLADATGNNALISPVQMLRKLADQIETGERKVCKSAIVILVDNEPEPDGQHKFWLGWSMADISCSVALAAAEAFKHDMLRRMGLACDHSAD